MIMELGSRHSCMRIVKISNTEVSGASEVPQSRGKLIFFWKPSCYDFAWKSISIDLDWSQSISIGVLSTSDS